MVLTRAVDNRLKRFFSSGEVQFRGVPFQGKGFRSLGQEAIYAAALRLRRQDHWLDPSAGWQGDVVGPLIRDAGVALAMRPQPSTVRMILNAQMGKAGPPMDGRDLHVGDFEHGILPPTAPLSISTLTLVGMALAFKRQGTGRVAVSFIGDGGSSLGEWHEAINAAAAHRLPMIFCIENNQIALSTPLSTNTAARVFADKAAATASPASRWMEPIPTLSLPPLRGRLNGRATDTVRRSSRSSACACAAMPIMTTCCTSALSRASDGDIRRSLRLAAMSTATSTRSGQSRIR